MIGTLLIAPCLPVQNMMSTQGSRISSRLAMTNGPSQLGSPDSFASAEAVCFTACAVPKMPAKEDAKLGKPPPKCEDN